MTVNVEHDGDLTIISLDDPARRNALNTTTVRALERAIVESSTKALLLRGEGPAFCAGADLKGGVHEQGFFDALASLLQAIVHAPVPVIADVQGPAVGAGALLALACDLRVFGEAAALWIPAAKHGFALDTWSHLRVRELLGGAFARNVMIGGSKLGAQLALSTGVAVMISDAEGALSYAHSIAQQSPLTMEYSKRVYSSADPLKDESLDELFQRVWGAKLSR